MKKIMAIGGGEISRRETLKIDRRIIKLSGQKRPKFLFIPTASSDDGAYVRGLSPIKPPQAAKKTAARPQVMHI